MASELKSDNSNLVLNADGVGNKVVIQENGIDQELMKRLPTAWANFDGTDGTIRDSYNVSSVTRVDIGTYTIVFTVPMDSINYVVSGTLGNTSNASNDGVWSFKYGESQVHLDKFDTWTRQVTPTTSDNLDFDIVSIVVYGGKN